MDGNINLRIELASISTCLGLQQSSWQKEVEVEVYGQKFEEKARGWWIDFYQKKGVCLNTVSVKYERSLGERKMSRGLVTCHGFK